MADYATHAQNARELLEAVDAKSAARKRHYDTAIAAAQVEAILALAAAVAEQGIHRPGS
ncbi:hypothetical protein ACN6K9_002854 [Streptomyces sp. SAS_267]|uniref:hypothetical protein n=1 Tax=unclassified Streptomyces TaxID=2593676 RepID=UPI003667E466